MTDLPNFRLDGKVALVTGASSGLGVRFANILAKSGASVVLAARRTDKLREVEKAIEGEGGKVISVALDVTNSRSVTDAFQAAEGALGPVNIVVNNAGMAQGNKITEIPETEYETVMDTNTKGAFLVAQEAGRRMIAAGKGGRIVNIASVAAYEVLPGSAVYNMSKAAVAMMTRAMAREWARYNINVTAICPGFILTDINRELFDSEYGKKQVMSYPRRRLAVEADLDGALLLLCSDASRAITGTTITVDDGQYI
jgi:NAD(P)-dependent dehydrogenase (short-subunit alcohol dehydrogenase family)